MSKFNLGDYLKPEAGVSDLGMEQEQLRYIPLDQIDPDPNNFYSLEGLDELAGNIELIGLQQPLRVRPNGERWTVVSGHRRRAACLLIRDGGSHMFDRGVPCLVDYGEASSEMRELRLIYANSSTRVLSSAEQSKQAERVTELLYKLQEQGVVFPGRMRDHVAEACNLSKSKIGRLHAIRANLAAPLLERFDRGEINEDVAYRLSQEREPTQETLARKLGPAVGNLTKADAEAVIGQIKNGQEAPAEMPEPDPPEKEPDVIKTLSAYMDGRKREDKHFFEMLRLHARGWIRELSSRSNGWDHTRMRQDGIECLKKYLQHAGSGGMKYDYDGTPKGILLNDHHGRKIERTWTEVYDFLCVLALQSAANSKPQAELREAGPRWNEGTPPKTAYYAARLEFYGKPIVSPRVLWWDEGIWYNVVGDDIRQHQIGKMIRVVGWYPLPEKG